MEKFLFNIDVLNSNKEINKVNLLANADTWEEAQTKIHRFFEKRDVSYSINHQYIVHSEI